PCRSSSFCPSSVVFCCFFFFQAEDGIRDFHVTGVQTCALPISANQLVVDRIAEIDHPYFAAGQFLKHGIPPMASSLVRPGARIRRHDWNQRSKPALVLRFSRISRNAELTRVRAKEFPAWARSRPCAKSPGIPRH